MMPNTRKKGKNQKEVSTNAVAINQRHTNYDDNSKALPNLIFDTIMVLNGIDHDRCVDGYSTKCVTLCSLCSCKETLPINEAT